MTKKQNIPKILDVLFFSVVWFIQPQTKASLNLKKTSDFAGFLWILPPPLSPIDSAIIYLPNSQREGS